jgi:hypothetical protein
MAGDTDSRANRSWLTVLGFALVMFGLAWPQLAAAAPYCLEARNLKPLCIYTDPNACRLAASKNHGYCGVNATTSLSQSGISRYCIVQPDLSRLCIFPDRQSCDAQATSLHTACVSAAPNQGSQAFDPFRLVRP